MGEYSPSPDGYSNSHHESTKPIELKPADLARSYLSHQSVAYLRGLNTAKEYLENDIFYQPHQDTSLTRPEADEWESNRSRWIQEDQKEIEGWERRIEKNNLDYRQILDGNTYLIQHYSELEIKRRAKESAEKSHNKPETKEDIDQSIESILNVQLNVENINTYADDAFKKLLKFADKKVADYQTDHSVTGLSGKEIEDAAFKHYGLTNIDLILTHIAFKAEEIRNIDNIVDRAIKDNTVIIPPDDLGHTITKGNGEFEEKRTFDRLKTILFILKEDFDINVHDDRQLTIEKGVLNHNMVRKSSYYLINAPSIDRNILVCDEEGNASFVFNSQVLRDKNINHDQLINSTKLTLESLITETPNLGRRVIYRKESFVPTMIDSLKNPISTIPDKLTSKNKDAGKYLYPKPPENYLSVSGIAKKHNINRDVVSAFVKKIHEQLGEVGIYRSRGPITQHYSPEQQEIILEILKKEGKWNEKAIGDIVSASKFMDEHSIESKTFLMAIEATKDQLGTVKSYLFETRTAPGYTPEQQKIILRFLIKEGKVFEPAPDGYLPMAGIARTNGFSENIVSKAIKSVLPQLGSIGRYLYPDTHSLLGYSPEQQKIILNYLQDSGKSKNIELAPENYMSSVTMLKEFHVTPEILSDSIEKVRDKLGEVKPYIFKTKHALGYSPEQQKIITEQLEKDGKMKPELPKDYLAISSFAEKNNFNRKKIPIIIATISEQLGEIGVYRLPRGGSRFALSPEQQEKIIKYINNHPKK